MELRTSHGYLLREWRDSDISKVETRMDRIGRDLIRLVPILRFKSEEEDRQRQAAAVEEERRQRVAAQAELTEQRRALLAKMAEGWSVEQGIRAFLAAAEQRMAKDDAPQPDRAWLQWAAEWADSLDPFRAGTREIAAQFENLRVQVGQRHGVEVG